MAKIKYIKFLFFLNVFFWQIYSLRLTQHAGRVRARACKTDLGSQG